MPEDRKEPWIEASKTLVDTAKIMLPFVTGSFVFVASKLVTQDNRPGVGSRRWPDWAESWSVSTATFTFAAFVLWSGVLPCCIRALRDEDQKLFSMGQKCAQAAHVCFILALISEGALYLKPGGSSAIGGQLVIMGSIILTILGIFLRFTWSEWAAVFKSQTNN